MEESGVAAGHDSRHHGGSDVASTGSSAEVASPSHRTRRIGKDDFETLSVLGRGGFAKVVLVRRRGTDEVYAMKILKKRALLERKQTRHTQTERSVLGFVNHPFIVGLHFAFQTQSSLYFVLDYCAGGELFHHLQKRKRFSEDTTRFFTAQLVLALSYLHTRGVVYRDLKPENILLSENGYIRIADFGLSKENMKQTEGSTSFCGTPEYLAPEIINGTGHGTAVDWWSLGMLVYEMLTGLPPWYTTSKPMLYDRLRSAELEFKSRVSPVARDLISRFLQRDPTRRLGTGPTGLRDIVEHPFFGSVTYFRSLLRQEVPAPIIPSLPGGPTDTSNFDVQFTALPVVTPGDGASDLHRAAAANGAEGHVEPSDRAAASGSDTGGVFRSGCTDDGEPGSLHYDGFSFRLSPLVHFSSPLDPANVVRASLPASRSGAVGTAVSLSPPLHAMIEIKPAAASTAAAATADERVASTAQGASLVAADGSALLRRAMTGRSPEAGPWGQTFPSSLGHESSRFAVNGQRATSIPAPDTAACE